MDSSLRHIAIFIPDLRAAERYYQGLFDMELIGREVELDDGLWHTLPFDKGWDDAAAAGIELGMSALRKDSFVLALFRGEAPTGQVFAIGLTMPGEQIVNVHARLEGDSEVYASAPNYLEFRDPYRIIWQIAIPGYSFRTAGDFANRWLRL